VKDHEKTKEQLVAEVIDLRQRCADLHKSADEATLEEVRSSEVICQQQAILDNIPDNVWHKDKEGLYLAVNDPFGKDVGVAPEEMVGMNDYDIYPPELAAKYERDSREVMTTGDRTYFEETIVDPELSLIHI